MLALLWDRLFLTHRPSIGLSFFRISVALTTGFHVIPAFFHMEDNFYHTAFKELNGNFFTTNVLEWIQKSPDGLVAVMAVIFCASSFSFLVGFCSQISCIILTACCYYFYALNSFFIGTLSWDILLVTLFLMCVAPYHGDYFSIDCLLKKDSQAYKTLRPFFIQRLLQLQIASVFFYTALFKFAVEGNWFKENPVYYLMNGPASGVAKFFILRDWMALHPKFCYFVGLCVVGMEFLLPVLLFYSKTRVSAIYWGIFFHVVLILTLDVPAIFFFLFPAQFLLFINPEEIVRWIEQRREYHRLSPRPKLIYDGRCGFCLDVVDKIKVMDLFNRIEYVNFRVFMDLNQVHPQLNNSMAASQIYWMKSADIKGLYGGFEAFRQIVFILPMLFPLIFIVYFPGMGVVGPRCYRWIAKNRFLLHRNKSCLNNACFSQ